MNKEELRELAEWGARRKVADIERSLDMLQREFPHIFITSQRPVLLKAELRESGSSTNGNRSASYVKRSISAAKSWTPERRAQYSKLMKARQSKMRAARGLAPKNPHRVEKPKKTGGGNASNWKQQWYDHLKKNGPQQIGASAKALSTTSGTLLSSAGSYLKKGVIKKTKDKGGYAIGPTQPPAAKD